MPKKKAVSKKKPVKKQPVKKVAAKKTPKKAPKKGVGAYLFGGMAGAAARAANKRKRRLDKI